MASLGPAEVLEHFAEDLSRATSEFEHSEAARAEAAQTAEKASHSLRSAEETESAAISDLEALRRTVIASIESSAGDDIDSREVLSATMAARGRSEEDIDRYFSHVDAIEEEKQPIAIIANSRAVGLGGLKVVYGLTLGRSGDASIDSKNKVQFSKNDDPSTLRDVAIPVTQTRGFRIAPEYRGSNINVFAKWPYDETVEPVVSNERHDFDKVHFAGSADEVQDVIDWVEPEGKRADADQTAVDAIGLPTMVAYGEDAVMELSTKIQEKGDRFRVLSRRCLEGLGIDLGADNITDLYLSKVQKKGYYDEFHNALVASLAKGLSHGAGQRAIAERLAFWAPLQKAIGYSPEAVLEEIEVHNTAAYSSDKRYVVTQGNSSSTAVKEELATLVQRAEDFGIQAVTDRSSIRDAASRVKRKEIYRALNRTPRHKIITRSRMHRALDEA